MNRRILEGIVVTVVLMKPVLGATRLWAQKTWMATAPGSFWHGVADVVCILS